jgi:hypothetical protein
VFKGQISRLPNNIYMKKFSHHPYNNLPGSAGQAFKLSTYLERLPSPDKSVSIVFVPCIHFWPKLSSTWFNVQLWPLPAQTARTVAAFLQTFVPPEMQSWYQFQSSVTWRHLDQLQSIFLRSWLFSFVTSRKPHNSQCIYTECSRMATVSLKYCKKC